MELSKRDKSMLIMAVGLCYEDMFGSFVEFLSENRLRSIIGIIHNLEYHYTEEKLSEWEEVLDELKDELEAQQIKCEHGTN